MGHKWRRLTNFRATEKGRDLLKHSLVTHELAGAVFVFVFFGWGCILFLADLMLQFSSFSRSVMSDSLRPHELQRTRPPCPLPTAGVYPNPCPSGPWCHPTISSSVVPFSSCPQSFPASVFSSESALCIRWPKNWKFSFNISPSNEHTGLIFFRMD